MVETLGARRAEAFLSGKLKIDRFVDDFGKPLTLSELKLVDSRGKLLKLRDVQSSGSISLKEIEAAESVLARQKVEHALAWDSADNYLFYQKGTRDRVSFSEAQARSFARGIVTHNHPNAVPFSPADLRQSHKSNLGELRAVGQLPDFRQVLYRLRPPKAGWASVDRVALSDELERRLTSAWKRETAEPLLDRLHETWSTFAEEHGLLYERQIKG